jgi:membrane complex biogenesis BtpA family protein
MVHLGPLPGAPRYGGRLAPVVEAAQQDAETLAQAEVDAIMVENFGDAPFCAGAVAPETVASMATVATKVAETVDLPLGINILRNDGRSALAVAHAVGARFIRVNVLSWARLTDQGLVQGIAAELQRSRAALRAEDILVLADVDVKHSAPLAPVAVEDESQDVVERGLADAVIVSGSSTASPVDLDQARRVAAAVDVPVLIGSGTTVESAAALRGVAQGAIVGSAMMHQGQPGGRIELDRARALVQAWRQAC